MTGFPNATNFAMPNPQSVDPSVKDAQSAFKHAQQAQMVSQNFGLPLQQNAGMWANILPAAIQIEEHKKMNEVAQKYQDQYVKNFNDRYGFKKGDLDGLKKEFSDITDHITGLIPDGDLQTMYKKYVKSYPNMYLSMIPQEALQAKLAVKCVRENKVLREEVTKMSKCVTTLVQGLSKLQMAAGVPPIVSLMFESMPDPLTAITDPMYSSYNDAITTYHSLAGLSGANSSLLLSKPTEALNNFISGGDILETDASGSRIEITTAQMKELLKVIENMETSSGCQTYGDEWNHTGPEPAMNPAMCLAESESMQPGNPRNAHGRTAVYKAQRTQDGGAQWVMKGQVPNVMGDAPADASVFNHAQMMNSARYHQQPAGNWSEYAPGGMPAPVAPRPKRKSSKASKKKRASK